MSKPTKAEMMPLPTTLEEGQSLSRIETPYHTALRVAVRRDIEVVTTSALAEAKLMADDFFYSWDVNDRSADDGKKNIIGVTVDGAMMLLRHWGNAVCVPEVLEEHEGYWLFRASFVDLEKGTTVIRLYRKHRSTAPGKLGNTDEGRQRWDDMQFSDGQSRAIRNAVASALPNWLVDRCMKEALKAAAERVDPEKERRAIVLRAKKSGITREQLEKKLHKAIDQLDASDLVTIRALLRTIEEKHAAAADIFGEERDPKADERRKLVESFAKSLQNCKTWEEGERLGVGIREATSKGLIDEDGKSALKEIWRLKIVPLAPPDDPPAADGDGSAEPPEPGSDVDEEG